MDTKVVDAVVEKVTQDMQTFVESHPKVPAERLKIVKANIVERAHKVAMDKEFKDQLKEGLEFLRSDMRAVSLEFSAYNVNFYSYQIDFGFAINPKQEKGSVVINLCSPEDTSERGWRPHIAIGLLGHRLKRAITRSHDTSWHYPVIDQDIHMGSKIEIIKRLLDDLHTRAMDDDPLLPHCLRRAVADMGYRNNPTINRIKLPTRRSWRAEEGESK